ncbi:unnamed protein product [Brassica rapa]|uniref:Leucine-rich repeat-containing N-terminal plant-type domain-containing protein n=2 Tax=Brassica TaxID=3705 RepID=A0A3P6C1W0_BRACM|nr:unnamed protein product [Brassica napus]CAG7897448.1 unnamed protein product [Brassica rapa]CDY67420.1 BnaAnng24230D [Brassica napus]VDD03491.1 unnamed protein product [Brassica rapa]
MTILSVLLTTLLLSLPLPSTQDLNADRAALLSLRSSVGGRTFHWDIRQTSPCNWAGVKCDNNRVTALRLPGVSLSGTIPNGVFGNLTRLRTLSLRLNALAGSLSLDLTTSSDLHSPVCSELDLTIPVPSLEFPARPRRLGCGW